MTSPRSLDAVALVVVLASIAGAQAGEEVTPGAPAVEALLGRLSAESVIVPLRDARTGDVLVDEKLGTPRFEVPDTRALGAAVQAHRTLMQEPKSRMALIGCAQLATPPSAPGWIDLLRAVGREWDDGVSVQISFQIAAKHGLMPMRPKALDALQRFVNRAIAANALRYHGPERGRRAALSVAEPAKLRELIDAHRGELGPDVVDAAIALSRTRIDHAPLLRAIGQRLPDATAAAYASERAGQDRMDDLKPEAAAAEFEAAIHRYDALHDTPSKARVLIELARTRRELGRSDEAIDKLRAARKILEPVHDGNHPDIAVAIKRIAEIYSERGEVQRALQSYVEAIQKFLALPADQTDFAESADVFRLFAGINARMGHLPEARANLQQAVFLLAQADTLPRPPDTRLVRAKALRDLGLLNLAQGRLPEARKEIDSALEIQMNTLGAVDPETIETLLALGQVCGAADEPGAAEFATREAAIFLQHHYGIHHPALVRAYAQRTSFRMTRQDFGRARAEIDRGLNSARLPSRTGQGAASVADNLPTRDTVALLTWKGELAIRAADSQQDADARGKLLDEAIDAFDAAERVFDTIRGAMPGEGDRMLIGDQAPEFTAGLLAAYWRKTELPTHPDVSAPIFEAAERSTARGLVATLGQDVADRLGGVSEADRARERGLFIARDAAMRRFNRLPFDPQSSKMTPAQLEAWDALQKASGELSAFSGRIRRNGVEGSGSPVGSATPAQAVELLDPNAVAVSFVLGSRESFAVVLAPGDGGRAPSVTLQRLPAASELDERVSALVEPAALESPLVKPAAEALYDLLFAPIAERVGGRDLVIVPTGTLCRLPFELLREPGPDGRRYLGEARTVRYAPSLTALRTLRARARLNQARPDRAFWAMANPRDERDARRPSELDALPALPRAVGEVRRVAAIVSDGHEAPILVEGQASRSAVIKASEDRSLRRYRYLHFAAHAALEDDRHPLPGLILARTAGEEGFLDTDDVAHLDLNADLVVLSACESGRGRVFNGEGVRGLTGSFLIAGARGVVCSLWKVDDDETARFMEAFYARMKAGATPGVALKELRRAAARKHASPQWAAFILFGGVSP